MCIIYRITIQKQEFCYKKVDCKRKCKYRCFDKISSLSFTFGQNIDDTENSDSLLGTGSNDQDPVLG